MTECKRYDIDSETIGTMNCLVPSDDGEYVLASDYDALRAERDEQSRIAADWEATAERIKETREARIDELDCLARETRKVLERLVALDGRMRAGRRTQEQAIADANEEEECFARARFLLEIEI